MENSDVVFYQILQSHHPTITTVMTGPWFDQWYPECKCGWYVRGCFAMTISEARKRFLQHLAEVYRSMGREPPWLEE